MPKLKSIARGLTAAAASIKNDGLVIPVPPEKEEFIRAGKLVKCSHCECVKFDPRPYKLTTTFNHGFWADDATALVCKQCSKIEWFLGDF